MAKKERKIAVLGTAPATRHLAPFDDPDWEIWAHGSYPDQRTRDVVRRFDRWFELHDVDWLGRHPELTDHLAWLGRETRPVYVLREDPAIPSATPFDDRALLEAHGPGFLTSTTAWMLALALHEGAGEIGVWGVDMAGDAEYAHQKPGCLHFLALARLQGIAVTIAAGSDLARVPLAYPFNLEDPLAAKVRARRTQYQKQLEATESNLVALEQSRHQLVGLLKDLDYFEKNWT